MPHENMLGLTAREQGPWSCGPVPSVNQGIKAGFCTSSRWEMAPAEAAFLLAFPALGFVILDKAYAFSPCHFPHLQGENTVSIECFG